MRELLFLLLVLVCPLAMFLMMRGGHGHGGGGGHMEGHGARSDTTVEPPSLADLHRSRDEIDRLIEERKADEERAGSQSGGPTISNVELVDDGGDRIPAS